MPALNFKKQFIDIIINGEKSQTIRAKRKKPIKKGDHLYLYTAMRTKQCKKIGEATCSQIYEIYINTFGAVYINDNILSGRQVKQLAIADGFATGKEMIDWFENTHGLPFSGHIIYWHNFINYTKEAIK
ncbi:MAG: hypothetical protein ABFD07_12240 [Methanobacterium sp.]